MKAIIEINYLRIYFVDLLKTGTTILLILFQAKQQLLLSINNHIRKVCLM